MGLDITAYSQVKRLDIDHLCEDVMDQAYDNGNVPLYLNPDFPEQQMGLEKGIYSCGERYGFRAGSYGGYNGFRETLAISAGYNPRDAWDGSFSQVDKPYFWMVNFSDCEGVINAAHSARLAREFREGRERFVAYLEEQGYDATTWYIEKYDDWQKAYDLASDNGMVKFH